MLLIPAMATVTEHLGFAFTSSVLQTPPFTFARQLSPIVGGTEAEAQAKAREYTEQLSIEAGLAHLFGMVGTDLSVIDPDRPLDDLQTNGIQGVVKGLVDSAPPGSRTFRDLVRANMTGQFTVGTPEQVADRLEAWAEAGADGLGRSPCSAR